MLCRQNLNSCTCFSVNQACSSIEPHLDLSLPPLLPAGRTFRAAKADTFCQCRATNSHSQGTETSSVDYVAAATRNVFTTSASLLTFCVSLCVKLSW